LIMVAGDIVCHAPLRWKKKKPQREDRRGVAVMGNGLLRTTQRMIRQKSRKGRKREKKQ